MACQFIKKLEKTLLVSMVVLLLGVILTNGYIYYNNQLRQASIDKGAPFNLQQLINQSDTITIKVAAAADSSVDIFLNGESVTTLFDQEEITLTVKDHDLIQARGNGANTEAFITGGDNLKKAYFKDQYVLADKLTTIALIRLL